MSQCPSRVPPAAPARGSSSHPPGKAGTKAGRAEWELRLWHLRRQGVVWIDTGGMELLLPSAEDVPASTFCFLGFFCSLRQGLRCAQCQPDVPGGILGNVSSLGQWLNTGKGCPGQRWGRHPWKCWKNQWMWHFMMRVGGVWMILEVFSNFSGSELLQVMIRLGMGTEPCASKADLTEKNIVKTWREQPGVG